MEIINAALNSNALSSTNKSIQESTLVKHAKSIVNTAKYATEEFSWTELVVGIKYLSSKNAKVVRDFSTFISESKDTKISNDQLKKILHFARICDCVDNKSLKNFLKAAKLHQNQVVEYKISATSERNGYVLIVDYEYKAVCLYINGTQTLTDLIHDLNSESAPFLDGYSHKGMGLCAKWFHEYMTPQLKKEMNRHDNFSLYLIGHSLGAAVCACYGLLLRNDFPDLQCICFATPRVLSFELAEKCKEFVTTFIYGDDFVPRASVESFRALKKSVVESNWKEEFVKDVETSNNYVVKLLKKAGLVSYIVGDKKSSTVPPPIPQHIIDEIKKNNEKQEDCLTTLEAMTFVEDMKEKPTKDEKETESRVPQVTLYPAGTLYHMRIIDDKVYIKLAKPSEFEQLELYGSWVQDHYCSKYYKALSMLYTQQSLPPPPKLVKRITTESNEKVISQNEHPETIEMSDDGSNKIKQNASNTLSSEQTAKEKTKVLPPPPKATIQLPPPPIKKLPPPPILKRTSLPPVPKIEKNE